MKTFKRWILYKKLPENDPLKRRPNISLAKEHLNWSPRITKENGIKLLIDYYRENKII